MDSITSTIAAVLDVLRTQSAPVGSRLVQRELAERGMTMSESTVSRMLVSLDERGLTAAVGQKGRRLTEEGRRIAETQLMESRRSEYFAHAFDMRSVEDLVDHLHARRGIEREAARAAALRATDAEIAQLHLLVASSTPVPLRERLAFHRAVGDASHNKQIQAIANTLFVERLDPLDSVVVMIGIRQGVLDQWEDEHRRIVACIAGRDADAAERTMVEHLDATIRVTEDFAASGNELVIRDLLADVIRR